MEKPIVYQVPVINMPWLQGKVEELNKKAKKLGTEPISFEIISTWTKHTKDASGNKYDKLMNNLVMTGIAPKIAGWSFLGTIQHTDNGNILRLINESAIPVEYRTVKRACDHCKKDRNRNDTYLVVSEIGEFKQLGKACLKDYTGHISPAYLAALAEFIDQLNKADDNEYDGGHKFQPEVPASTFLRLACEAVVKDGAYITRKMFCEHIATSDHAWMSLFPPRGKSTFVPLGLTDKGEELFVQVMQSLSDMEFAMVRNDFEHNVLMAWKKGVITHREAGLLAAAILIYEKGLIKRLNLQKDSVSNFVGAVKTKLNVDVTVHKKISFDTQWGSLMIILMKDAAGNILVWKTGTGTDYFSVGDKVTVQGTVKAHEVYKEIKQTVLTRCKVSDPERQIDEVMREA